MEARELVDVPSEEPEFALLSALELTLAFAWHPVNVGHCSSEKDPDWEE